MGFLKKRLVRKLTEKVDQINIESSKEEEEFFYIKAAEEIYSGEFRRGLYFKIFAECDGDEKVAQARYIKERCLELLMEKKNTDVVLKNEAKPVASIKKLPNSSNENNSGLLNELINDFKEIYNEK